MGTLLRLALSPVEALLDPLSAATVPLLYGLARRMMLRGGATQGQARVKGLAINYYQHGPGGRRQVAGMPNDPALPIVLVHGIADNALTWALVMRSLARDADVYALDLPGYGLS